MRCGEMFCDQSASGGGDDGRYGRLEPDACYAGDFMMVSCEPARQDVVRMSTTMVRRMSGRVGCTHMTKGTPMAITKATTLSIHHNVQANVTQLSPGPQQNHALAVCAALKWSLPPTGHRRKSHNNQPELTPNQTREYKRRSPY